MKLGMSSVLPRRAIDALKASVSTTSTRQLTEAAASDPDVLLKGFGCSRTGLAEEEAARRLEQVGPNAVAALAEAAEHTTLFARLAPAHKQRVIKALQSSGHVVGFLGDGINDAPALRAADVGISVDSAVDIAKESADLILLEKSLLVLEEGILEGRRVFANILKYVRMGASSSFGNMFSVVGASAFLPFMPMAPLQIPFIQSRAAWPLTLTTLAIMAFGVWLPFSPLASVLGFTRLPPLYWPLLLVTLIGYVLLTQRVKSWLIRKVWI